MIMFFIIEYLKLYLELSSMKSAQCSHLFFCIITHKMLVVKLLAHYPCYFETYHPGNANIFTGVKGISYHDNAKTQINVTL